MMVAVDKVNQVALMELFSTQTKLSISMILNGLNDMEKLVNE